MAETASVTYTYCGEPEPTDACERGGWCDYHLGTMPGGPGPWDRDEVVSFEAGGQREALAALYRSDTPMTDAQYDAHFGCKCSSCQRKAHMRRVSDR